LCNGFHTREVLRKCMPSSVSSPAPLCADAIPRGPAVTQLKQLEPKLVSSSVVRAVERYLAEDTDD
jgi:hypothetical protein